MKIVASFKNVFQQSIWNIPGISLDAQIDLYIREFELYIFKELCTKEYTTVSDAMEDNEGYESARSIRAGR